MAHKSRTKGCHLATDSTTQEQGNIGGYEAFRARSNGVVSLMRVVRLPECERFTSPFMLPALSQLYGGPRKYTTQCCRTKAT